MIRIIGLVTVLAGIIMTSCGSAGSNNPPGSEPDFSGFITGIERNGSGSTIGRITIESHADKLVRRHVVTVTNETVIFRSEGEKNHPETIDNLKVKDWAKLWFKESRTQPYPTEVTAQKILIVEHL